MSELYLVLRHRLETVVDWVAIDGAVMKEARERLGLSYEGVARQVPISAKTYERYEKKGRIPRPLLRKIAAIIELEIEEPERIRVALDDDGDTPADQRFEDLLDRLEQIVEGLEGGQEQPPDG